ncbi:haloacid dehalogenase-like hydrolase family member protein [Theileria equi strain WA]|uniref:Haloacid dehalogenase-like hydrolase family member protein n=1 Tax=Theileria equi strain WA TaxID=1537102 RepID=L1LBH7_THEEQ|nr:haloacid dehalogenase-like hydrolase family member protein [Theileria equi strain WA]EKX72762.1 haloacid dehalogenase-like hydrolase family member protein [Theileria equi strain WA]|eukprot:XP_004832214.1 haloacid dehalogenase-like hydrolase family member protein [Theileria equi strain WA]
MILYIFFFFCIPFRLKGVICGDTDGGTSVDSNISQFLRLENPPKYFGIDIDGTFYTDNKESWKKNLDAFSKARKNGFVPFICTGRTFSGVSDILKDMEEETGYKGYPGVYNNGSIVYDENGSIMYSKAFSKEFVKAVCEHVTECRSLQTFVFYTKDGQYSLTSIHGNFRFTLELRGVPNPKLVTGNELLSMDILALSVCCNNFKFREFKEGTDYVCKTARSGFCNVNPAGVTKALGLKNLMEHYGLSPKDCGFIGNADNDIEAMDFCDHSFCVDDAPDFVKRHAKWVLDKGHDEGAVAQALELLYTS